MENVMKNKAAIGAGQPRVIIMTAVSTALLLMGLFWMSRPRPLLEVPAAPEPLDPIVATTDLPVTKASHSTVEEQWGIQIASVALTNADTAVDLRYTVVAPERTGQLTGADVEVYLIDQDTGAKLPMITAQPESTGSSAPTPPPSRTTRKMMRLAGSFPPPPSRIVEGRSYSLQIPNWGGVLKSGGRVTMVIGGSRAENLIVE
jgi:hypothetical protein